MRRLIVGTLVSLDGVSGEPRSWATPYFDEHATERALAQLMASDAQTLLEHDLVDELHFSIHPVILGSGTPLFRPGQMKTLRLTSLDQLPTGVVSIGFARADDDQEA